MAEIVWLHEPPRRAPDPYRELQRARTLMISAWTAYLATNPPGDDVVLEVNGTINAMRSLADLHGIAAGQGRLFP